jgi:hypothetical protein
MSYSIYRAALRGMLALTLSLAAGCAMGVDAGTDAEDPAAREPGEATDPQENVATAEEALTACYQVYHHGGNFTEQDYEILMGCGCGPGYVRSYHQVWNNGNGSCYAVNWASPDPSDCMVRVHIHDAAWFGYGDCNVQVEATPAPAPACAHGRCSTGAALNSGCDSCVSSICAVDPYCCNTYWDSICVNEVSSVCHSSCP